MLLIVSLCLSCGVLSIYAETSHKPIKSSTLEDTAFETIAPYYFETDVNKLISIKKPKDADQLRKRLISFLWGTLEFPEKVPAEVQKNFLDKRYQDISNLHSIDKLVVRMEFGLESHIYHFHPRQDNGKVILFHEGHSGDFYTSKSQIKQFLDSGYSIIAFCMPLFGLNNKPVIFLPRLGRIRLTTHDHMKFLSPKNGHPVKYFVEPAVVVINYLQKNYNYKQIAMVGISGGGWTTTLVAAIDQRVKMSFPVAGTYPIYLRPDRDWGDWEQTVPELYNTTNYLEMYVLGAFGVGRKQLQVINKYDPCCFNGLKWQTYKDSVIQHVNDLGSGSWDLFLDDSHKGHIISPVTMDRILCELDKR